MTLKFTCISYINALADRQTCLAALRYDVCGSTDSIDSHTCGCRDVHKKKTYLPLPHLLEARMWQRVCGTLERANIKVWRDERRTVMPLFFLPCSALDLTLNVYDGATSWLLQRWALFRLPGSCVPLRRAGRPPFNRTCVSPAERTKFLKTSKTGGRKCSVMKVRREISDTL